MDNEIWNNQLWILSHPYPKGIKKWVHFMVLSTILLLFTIYYFKYPIYHTFYGYVYNTREPIVTIMVPFDEINEFLEAIENNNMKLLKVDSEIQYVNGQSVVKAEVIVSIKKQLLVENNIVPIRVKVKDVSIYDELSQKWKRGINDEGIK